MSLKITTDSWSAKRPYARLTQRNTANGNYHDGAVVTPFGIVEVYREDRASTFRFVWREREYARQIEPSPTVKSVIRMASTFAREIANGGGQ